MIITIDRRINNQYDSEYKHLMFLLDLYNMIIIIDQRITHQ